MGLFSKLRTPGASSPADTPDVKSSETTPVQSGAPSITDDEKKDADASVQPTESRTDSQTGDVESKEQPLAEVTDGDNEMEKRIEGLGHIDTNDEDDESKYPKSTQFALISVALCLSVFCMALDNTIIATAIPKITDEFHAINDVGWYGS